MKPNVIGIFTALFLAFSAGAQEARPIKLREAIDLSIQNSKQLKISAAKIDEATAALKQAQERRLPDASVSGGYLRLTAANITSKTGSNGGGGAAPKVNQAMYGILNASLPLYAGGRINYGIESSRLLAEATRLDAKTQKEEVIQNTIEAYVNLYKAGTARKLVDESLRSAQQRVKDLSNLEKNGLLARNDLMKAELQASTTELALVDVENNLQLANLNMTLLLGLPGTTIIIPDSSSILQPIQLQGLDEYLQSALQHRSELEALQLRRNAADIGVKAVKAEKLPSIALTGGYVAADIPKFISITNAANIGIGVQYNLASLWKNKSKLQEAEARAAQLSATSELVNDQVRLQVNRAYLNYNTAQKRIDVYQKAIAQATENYRIVNNKFNNQLATVTDVLDAQVALDQARLNLSNAQADAVVVYNELLQAAGLSSK